MQQVLFRIPFKTAWFPERFPFWAAVVTLAWVVLIIFWVVARLGTPRESGRWSFSSALPWLAAGIGATLLLKRLLTGVEISGGVPIYGFGMMLFLAFLLCTWLASRRAEREGVPRGHSGPGHLAIRQRTHRRPRHVPAAQGPRCFLPAHAV